MNIPLYTCLASIFVSSSSSAEDKHASLLTVAPLTAARRQTSPNKLQHVLKSKDAARRVVTNHIHFETDEAVMWGKSPASLHNGNVALVSIRLQKRVGVGVGWGCAATLGELTLFMRQILTN